MSKTDERLRDFAETMIDKREMTLTVWRFRGEEFTDIWFAYDQNGFDIQVSRVTRGRTYQETLYQPAETVWIPNGGGWYTTHSVNDLAKWIKDEFNLDLNQWRKWELSTS